MMPNWTARCTASFTTKRDLRDLLLIEHPWTASRKGGFGEWSARVRSPEDWRPGRPLFVSFYQFDNYSGSHVENPWLGTQAFIGHRFKQLLVNGRLVWESDVADEEFGGTMERWFNVSPGERGFTEPYRLVEISAVARRENELTFRVINKVASTVERPGDAYRRFSWSACNPDEAKKCFQTSVYFGDVELTGLKEIVRPKEKAPVVRKKLDRCVAFPKAGLPLKLVAPDRLPSPGYPVRCGVPMVRSSVKRGMTFALRDPRGRPVPLATRELSHWPDGSVRWLLCECVAKTSGTYRLVMGESVAPKQAVKVRGTTITNGLLTLRIGKPTGPGVFAEIECSGGLNLGSMDFSIKLNRVGWRDQFTAQRRSVTVERSSPVSVVIRLDGDMVDEKGNRFGPWRARLHLWSGLPYVIVEWRLINESDQSMAMLLDWSARIALPDVAGAVADFGPFEKGYDLEDKDLGLKAIGHRGEIDDARSLPLHKDSELSCRQERADHARIYRNTSWVASAKQGAGFVNLRHAKGGVVGAMRWFAEEFPKGIVVRPNLLNLATMPESEDAVAWPHDRPWVRIGRGEAKRQTFALWLHDGTLGAAEAERFAGCVNDSPHFLNQKWFIDSEVIEAGPARDSAKLAGWRRSAPHMIERTGLDAPRLGHREYWDTAWSNDYRSRTHAGLIQYFETADPRWLRYFDAACTHNRDMDIIHFCPEHPDWVGSMHSYGEDHTTCGPMGNIGLNVDGQLDHYLMTGDPESLEAAAGLANHVLTCYPWGRCARCVGWPLAQLTRWYEQTHDERFLRKITEFVAAACTYLEPRRGVLDEIHGSFSYRGAVTFMVGYLAFGLIRHHQLTGSAETLRMLEKTAAGLFAETCVAPGRFRYSPFPENNFSAGGVMRVRIWNGLVGGLAGYLYSVTGEKQHYLWAKECYEGIVEKTDEPQANMDMLTIAGYMLRAVEKGPR